MNVTEVPEGQPDARRIQTLESLNDSQVEAIRKIPPYGVEPPPVMTVHYPVSRFTDRAFFDKEQAQVFRRIAVPILPSAALKAPGSVAPHDGYGLPLLLARDKGGKVRVFLNACQHKGAKLVEGCEARTLSRLTCPYHSWTYALDGALIAAARQECFLDLDKAEFALAELPSREWGGIVWAVLNRDLEPDFSALRPELEADLVSLEIPTSHLYGSHSFKVKANWKLILEPFMESYHVPRLHSKTVGPLFGDPSRIIDLLGPHQRKVAGKIEYHPDMLQAKGENIHKTVTFAYQIFPNAVLITSPYYTSFMVIMPVSERESIVDYHMLTLTAPQSEKAEDLYARSLKLVLQVFGEEDFRAAEISQVGLDSGALKRMTYGGMENTIPMYYEQLDAVLG